MVQTVITLMMNPAIDITTAVDRVVPEHKLRCRDVLREPGGDGSNVSRALRELGDNVLRSIWRAVRRIFKDLLDASGLEHRCIAERLFARLLEHTT